MARFPVDIAYQNKIKFEKNNIITEPEFEGQFDDVDIENIEVLKQTEEINIDTKDTNKKKKRTRKPRQTKKDKKNKKDEKSEGIGGEKKFRVQGKHFLLTYMNINKTKSEVMNFFKEKFNIVKGVFSEEIAPTTGTYHVHCFVKLPMKKDIRSPRYFDIEKFHPNIETVKNGESVNTVDYVIKKGNYIDFGFNSKLYSIGKLTKDELFYRVMQGEMTIKELILCKPSFLTELKKIQTGLLEYWPILNSQGHILDHQW